MSARSVGRQLAGVLLDADADRLEAGVEAAVVVGLCGFVVRHGERAVAPVRGQTPATDRHQIVRHVSQRYAGWSSVAGRKLDPLGIERPHCAVPGVVGATQDIGPSDRRAP